MGEGGGEADSVREGGMKGRLGESVGVNAVIL